MEGSSNFIAKKVIIVMFQKHFFTYCRVVCRTDGDKMIFQNAQLWGFLCLPLPGGIYSSDSQKCGIYRSIQEDRYCASTAF